jgi:hypothetical protein
VIRFFKGIWRREKAFLHGIIKAQNWLLMALVYVFAVSPVAIVTKLFGRRMLDMSPPDPNAETYWIPRDDGPMTFERAKRRF